jgi:hypothetical protein
MLYHSILYYSIKVDQLPKMCMWQGKHMNTNAKLALIVLKDRKPLLALKENNRQILCCRISYCAAAGVH